MSGTFWLFMFTLLFMGIMMGGAYVESQREHELRLAEIHIESKQCKGGE